MNTLYPELQAAFDKLILSASGWRKVFAPSGIESDADPQITAADRDIVFFAAQVFAEFLHEEFPAITTRVVAPYCWKKLSWLLQQLLLSLTCSLPE